MNFTIALLAGLVLLLPGITALVAWNYLGSAHGARRPELQLTSVTALFLALGVATFMHVLGYGLVALIWSSAAEIGRHLPPDPGRPALLPNPYEMMVGLALGTAKPSSLSIWMFLIITLAESFFAWLLFASAGLDLALEGADVRSQGWVLQHVVRPARHGYKPVAYVLTSPAQGEYGIGYEGVIADIRQGENGEIRSISLAEPQRFVYHLMPARPHEPRFRPRLTTLDREWIGGIVVLDGAVLRNIVVHNVPADLIKGVVTEPSDGSEPEDAGGEPA